MENIKDKIKSQNEFREKIEKLEREGKINSENRIDIINKLAKECNLEKSEISIYSSL